MKMLIHSDVQTKQINVPAINLSDQVASVGVVVTHSVSAL